MGTVIILGDKECWKGLCSMNKSLRERSQYTEKEQEEDFLEELYLMQQKGCPLIRTDICRKLNMSRREFKKLSLQLMQQECLQTNLAEDAPLVLTTLGNVRAQELLKRHRYLTDFVQMICNVEKDVAEDNACRIEHVISSDVFCGIIDYMKFGERNDRIVEGWDINRFYESGIYDFRAGIYLPEKRYPRMLSPEHARIGGRVRAKVDSESFYLLQFMDLDAREKLWYLEDRQWRLAGTEEGAFLIPTRVLRYTICEKFPTSEGNVDIAITLDDAQPRDQDIRELNVHLW